MAGALTDIELKVFFDQLFPNGFAGADVLSQIAPKGWARSPLEQIRAEWQDSSVNVADQVTELVGQCLWDIFSDNHEVVAADGRLADIGSFRGASTFLDGYLNGDLDRGDHMRFYMGTIWSQDRADLGVIYSMIFQRLKSLGADWVYHFPELNLVDLTPLREDTGPSAAYSPSETFRVQQEDEQRQVEVEKMRAELKEMNVQSRKEAMDRRMPPTVQAYQQIYGRDPCGWPPVA